MAWLALAHAKAPDACWVPNRLQYTGRDTLVYTPLAEARLREAEAAKLERRDPRDVRAGWLALEVNRVTLAAADPAHQVIVVVQDGQEVHRFEPESEIPDTNPEVYGFWYSYAVVQLPEGLEPPFDVEVTDRLLSAKCTWSVDAAGTTTRKRKDDEDAQSSM